MGADASSDNDDDSSPQSAQHGGDKKREREAKREKERAMNDGGLLKISEALKDVDLYKLLEVSLGSSLEDIKKSYRRLALAHHPDKQAKEPAADASETEEQRNARFLMIQEAYEILTDDMKRRRYDSTIDFDDSIPEKFPKGKGGSDFFAVFGPVFRRNAMWSVKRPVPDLGDKDTPIAQTNKFYDFWNSFDSRRDPLAIAEKLGVELCNLAEAECREERRWMERENAKEGRRIKKAEKEAVAAAKLATAEAARLEKEAKAKAAEEERLAKERQEAEKRRIDKEKREEAKRAVRNSRQRV